MPHTLLSPAVLAVDPQPVLLVSPWKPVLILAFFTAWAWVVATIYDKDAQRWYFKRAQWNFAHLAFGVVALAAALLMPSFWIGLPAMVLILGADLAIYYNLRNRDHRVGENAKWKLSELASSMKRSQEGKEEKRKVAGIQLKFNGPGGPPPLPEKDTPEYEIRIAAEDFLIRAIDARASRIELVQASKDAFAFSFTVDGVRVKPEPVPAAKAVAVTDFLKRIAGLDLEERRKKQTGDLQVDYHDAPRTLRITTLGGAQGQRLTGVFDPSKQVGLSLDELGLLENQRDALQAVIAEKQGVVLLAAPAQNGRSATYYAMVRAHDAYTQNVQTLELEPLTVLEGVRQNQFDPTVDGAEFSTTARSILRRDPDVIAVAEIDPATAKELAKGDHHRTRAYASMKAGGALQAIQLWMKAVDDQQTAAEALHGVVAQKLVRRLCPNCKSPYQPTPDMLRKLGLPASVKQLFRKGGQVLVKDKPEVCPMCNGGGYLGQVGVFEVFPITKEQRTMLASGDYAAFRASLRERRLPSLQEAALRKAVEGVTSVEEVLRVVAPESASRKPQPQA